jgi:hypothetical protein
MSDRLQDGQREAYTDALGSWGMSPVEIAETLEGTALSLGLVELKPDADRVHPEIAIVVDDRRDPELTELFAWRESITDAAYDADWEVEQPPLMRVILGADEQALVRFGVTILKPARVERRFLLSVNADATLLTMMQISGTGIWLAASSTIAREVARGGPSDAYDLRSRCLVVGRVVDPIESLDEALAHVGSPRPVNVEPPADAAQP